MATRLPERECHEKRKFLFSKVIFHHGSFAGPHKPGVV
jgi:hypothetical protein